jgi:predicted nuclease of restriction endonuclease-like RecB superfamily
MEFLKRIFCFPFNKTHSRNRNFINEDVNRFNLSSLNESNNYHDLNCEQYIYNNQIFGLCPECNRPNTDENWCKECYSNKFKQNFDNWTSGNMQIDKFIQESQLSSRYNFELLEWIPYNRLRNIKFLAQGGFSTVYRAIWLSGLVKYWNNEKQDWERLIHKLDEQDYKDASNSQIKNPLKINEKYGYSVVLKSLNDSSNINENFLNEVSSCIIK